MRDRLLRAGFEAAEVDDVVSRLETVGLLNDEQFASEFAEHAVTVRRAGRRSIASSLYAKGVARDTVEGIIDALGDDEEARARELARVRAARLGGLEPAAAFRRLASLLMRRGYDPSVARSAAREALDIDPGDA